MKTFFGTKISTTAVFANQGRRQTISLIKALPLEVVRIKSQSKDGYQALVCRFRKTLREIRLDSEPAVKAGDQIKAADIFKAGDIIKVSGRSKGRGFAGVVKRYGFAGGPKTHGQSDRQRAPGSIGMRTTPGRIWKGKRMAGHYGVETITIKNLKVIKIEADLVTVSGTVPGSRNNLLTLTKL